MNAIEKLLKLDANKIKMPQKDVEVKRLSESLGEKIVFKLKGVPAPERDSIREMAINSDSEVNITEFRKGMILAGVSEPNLRDESLRKHFNAATPYDLIDKLFLPGESDALYEQITELSGFGEDAVAEIKN